jgi:hypothetical protein
MLGQLQVSWRKVRRFSQPSLDRLGEELSRSIARRLTHVEAANFAGQQVELSWGAALVYHARGQHFAPT